MNKPDYSLPLSIAIPVVVGLFILASVLASMIDKYYGNVQ